MGMRTQKSSIRVLNREELQIISMCSMWVALLLVIWIAFIKLLMLCILIFTLSSVLCANTSKLAIYLARVPEQQQRDILTYTSLPLGKLSFKYLGVPLNSKRLLIANCEKLVDKMNTRIRGWQGKHCSYAARLQLVHSVLMSITTYWCQTFVLPKKVIKAVNSICRAFLWHHNSQETKPRNVNWDSLCRPKKEGGLGIKNLELWNRAVIGKIIWHLSCMHESLWVCWIHGVYTKGGRWMIFNPPPTTSWVIRKLCKVKDQMCQWINSDVYNINTVYKELIGFKPRVNQCTLVWHRFLIPKARFIFWLAMLNKLKTKDHS